MGISVQSSTPPFQWCIAPGTRALLTGRHQPGLGQGMLMESLRLESLLLSVPSCISVIDQSLRFSSKHLRAAFRSRADLWAARSSCRMAAVLLPHVVQPLSTDAFVAISSWQLQHNSQLVLLPEYLQEEHFWKRYCFENLATDSRKNVILQNFDKPKIDSSIAHMSNKNTGICSGF